MLGYIKVGGIKYGVVVTDKFDMNENEKREYLRQGIEPDSLTKWGEVEYQESEIRIWSGLSEQKKEQTIIHEMLHAIQHEAGIDEQNEDEVNRVALILHQVLKDNDFSWLGKGE